MDGFLNILKPPGISSGDVVFFVRRQLPKGARVGHGGTLDPDACGVLPVCVGSAVRLFDYIVDKEKTYLAEITLGVETDTQDASGKLVASQDPGSIGQAALERVLPEFVGTIQQTPPAYSAIKKDGHRLYALARKGQEIEVESREVWVRSVTYVHPTGPHSHLLRVECGKGVYIRTLLADIGRALGCGAHMSLLIREKAGAFTIDEGVALDQLAPETMENLLLPMDYPLEKYPRCVIGEEHRHFVKNGNQIKAEWLRCKEDLRPGAMVRLYLKDTFAGMGEITEEGAARFRAMLWKETEG